MATAPEDVFLPPEVTSVGQSRRRLPLTDARNASLPEGNFLDCTVATMTGEFNLSSWQKTIQQRPQFGMEKQVHTRDWTHRRSIASTDSMSAFSDDHSTTSHAMKSTLSKAVRVLGLLNGRDGHRTSWRHSTDELRSVDHVLLGSREDHLPSTTEDAAEADLAVPIIRTPSPRTAAAPDQSPASVETTFVTVASEPATRTPSISEKSSVTTASAPVVEILPQEAAPAAAPAPATPVANVHIPGAVAHSSPLRTKAEERARREQAKLDKLKEAVRARNARIDAAERLAREKKAAKQQARKEAKSAAASSANVLRWSSQLNARTPAMKA